MSPNKMLHPVIEVYDSAHIFIVNDRDRTLPYPVVNGVEQKTAHQAKCDEIHKVFSERVDCEVHSVHFPDDTSAQGCMTQLHDLLERQRKGNLVIIYYHGSAGGVDKQYTWPLSVVPAVSINAYEVVQMVSESKADALFLLDCWVHRRVQKLLFRPEGRNTEVMCRSAPYQNRHGRVVPHARNFTAAIVRQLNHIVTEIDNACKSWKSLMSIPEISRSDRAMFSPMQRIWGRSTRFDCTTIVTRIKIDPKDVREHGKIRFFCEEIQGKGETRLNKKEQELIRRDREMRTGQNAVQRDEPEDEAVDVNEAEDVDEADGLFVRMQ